MEESSGSRRAGTEDDENLDPASLLNFSRKRRLPVIQQTEASECGHACLAMIACYFGHQTDLLSLRLRFSTSSKGMTLSRLIEIAHEMDLSSRPIRVELQDVSQLEVPCILHWGMNHFVVLKKVRKHSVTIHDPANGERSISLGEFSRRFTGVALELSKGPKFKRKSAEPPLSLKELAGSVTGLGSSLRKIFAMALALEVFALLAPQLMQAVIDQVLADGDHDLLMMLGLTFSLLLLLQTAVTAMRTWTVTWVSANFNIGWSGNAFRHMLRLPQHFFLKRHLGDLVSRFGAINTIQQTLTTKFVEASIDGLMTMMTLVMLMLYSVPMALITLGAVLAYGFMRIVYFRIFREANLNQIITTAKQQGVLMETMRGVQTVQIHNQQAARSARFLNMTADVLNNTIVVQRLQLIFDALNSLTSGFQRIGVIWLGAWLALKGNFSAGMLIAFAAYADQFSTRAGGLVDYAVQLRLLRLQSERVADIVLSPPEVNLEGTYNGSIAENSPLCFKGVSYRYSESDPWVIKDCSFTINPGESVAIVGPSGCGKSTLARLMTGLLDPEEGVIELGGIDFRYIGKNHLRSVMSSVMQDDNLFNGSIAENVCFFDVDAATEDILQACELAGIHHEISLMPMGYQSLIGDMGSSLSGGQKQRLLLARALYRKPRILVLDEATSHLDLMNEKLVNEHVRRMNILRIVIAHRPETIKSCDRIVELREGRAHDINPFDLLSEESQIFDGSRMLEATQGSMISMSSA
jgi:ATP-binding cassette, subfamily B, bacterial CvaB/MchF/RaxB